MVFEFLEVLLQQTGKDFGGIANNLYSYLLDYLHDPSCFSLQTVHRFLKLCIFKCNCSPRLITELLRVTRTLKASSPLIPCFIEYLHFICSYEPESLRIIQNSLQQLINELAKRTTGELLKTVNELNDMSVFASLAIHRLARTLHPEALSPPSPKQTSFHPSLFFLACSICSICFFASLFLLFRVLSFLCCHNSPFQRNPKKRFPLPISIRLLLYRNLDPNWCSRTMIGSLLIRSMKSPIRGLSISIFSKNRRNLINLMNPKNPRKQGKQGKRRYWRW